MSFVDDLIDEAWYLIKYVDVGLAVLAGGIKSGGHHYNQHGWLEGRDPNVLFDTSYYLDNNADVRAALFAPGSTMTALEHYIRYGGLEGRDPGPYFDSSYYLQQNPDVGNALMNPLKHFMLFGGKEGRDPSANFDSSKYLKDNPDVGAAGLNPLQHFLDYGKQEGRQAFDTSGNKVSDPIIPTGGDKSGGTPNLKFTQDSDVIQGGNGNDFLDAPTFTTPEGQIRNTTHSSDIADLGGGFDVARLSLIPVVEAAQGFGVRPTLISLEDLLLRPREGTPRFDASGITGLEKLEVLMGTSASIIGNNVNAGVLNVVIRNDDGLGPPDFPASDVEINFSGSAVLDNGLEIGVRVDLEAGTLPAERARLGSLSFDSQEGDRLIRELDVHLGGSVDYWSLKSLGRASTLKLFGGQIGFEVTDELREFLTVDASALAGKTPPFSGNEFNLSYAIPKLGLGELFGVRFVPDTRPDVNTSYTGSSGPDRFDTRGGYTPGDIYNGGPGTDRIIYFTPNIEGFKLAVSATNLTSIEEVEVIDSFSGTLNLKHFNSVGIASFLFSSSSADDGTEDVFNLSGKSNTIAWSTGGGAIRDDLRIRVEFNGQSDAVNFALADTDAHEDLTFEDVETVRLGSVGGAAGSVNTVGGNLSGTTFAGGGSQFFLEGSTAFDLQGQFQGLRFDGSVFTGSGPVTFSTANGSASPAGVTLIGGGANDRLVGTANTGAANQDALSGGGGNDQLWVSVRNTGTAAQQADILTGGSGADFFVFRGDTLANVLALSSGTTAIVTIADFQSGSDKIALIADAPAAAFVLGAGQQIGAAADLAGIYAAIAALPASTAAAVHGAVVSVTAGAAAGSYLYVNDTVAGVSSGSDMLVRLGASGAGLTGADVALILR